MATGMVLVIVTRNIDLSVGSHARRRRHDHGRRAGQLLPGCLGFEHRLTWLSIVAARRGVALGGADRRCSRAASSPIWRPLLHRHARRPAGLARRRLVGHHRPDGRADGRHASRLMGGGATARSARPRAGSSRAVACAAIVVGCSDRRAAAQRFGFPLRPRLGRCVHRASSPARAILGAVWIANSYPLAGRHRAPIRRGTTASPGPKAACSSPTASPFRC